MLDSNRGIRSHGKANGVLLLLRVIRFILTFVSTSWRHPWDLIPMITLKRMSAMSNTTPLVTTVTKRATNPRDADASPKVNIQEFCEEYNEDILPIIMDKVRLDRRKDVHTRVRSTDLAKLTRQAQPNPDPVEQIPGTILGVEAVPTGWTLQMKIVRRIGNASVALGNHMMTSSLTPIVTETALAI
nr:hypothetical protein [Tanacetum cinerariifolium]